MSLVSRTIGLMQTTAMRHNASFASQNASQQMMGLANGRAMDVAMMGDAAYAPSPQFGGMSPMAALAQQDKTLMMNKVRSDIQFAAASAWYDSIAKGAKEDIKKDFSTFA